MRLLKFETATCPKCPVVSNFLMQQGVPFETVDAKKDSATAQSFQIMSVPTTILLDDENKEIARSTGVNPKELMQIIHTYQKGESSHV